MINRKQTKVCHYPIKFKDIVSKFIEKKGWKNIPTEIFTPQKDGYISVDFSNNLDREDFILLYKEMAILVLVDDCVKSLKNKNAKKYIYFDEYKGSFL